ncbi:hypothetical protein [Streptomyces sp. TP-A0356]|uniref:hypothetical protein n=1 Tax=Streptomyces sp. TP-A0356 TaxID=1359208 RepID=UPI0006E17022|nr:hypothetical protein [Streptomyces sp. TP-A0356]
MIAVALLLPASMLCLLLALGRYEERILRPDGDAQAQGARRERRLRAVREPAPDDLGRQVPEEPATPESGATAPGDSGTRWRAA